MKKVDIDKSRLKDKMGRPLTQGLFLEVGYNTDFAVYTLDDDHKDYKGQTYYSLKKLYLEEEDVVGYNFACKYLLGWQHWERLRSNKMLAKHIDLWEEELELKLKSIAVKSIIDISLSENGGFQASKWLADGGWIRRSAGRPSKEETEKHLAQKERIYNEYAEDLERVHSHLKAVE